MIHEDTLTSLTELAKSYIEVDDELKEELSERAEGIYAEVGLDYDSAYQILCEGATLFKRRNLIRAYEEARDAAKEDSKS